MIKPASAMPRSERKKKGLATRRNNHASIINTAWAVAKTGGPNGPRNPNCGATKTHKVKLPASIASKTMKIHLQYRDDCEADMLNAPNSDYATPGSYIEPPNCGDVKPPPLPSQRQNQRKQPLNS